MRLGRCAYFRAMQLRLSRICACLTALFPRLARNTAGNTLMLVAAALVPLVAIIGSGVDIGRAYLAESRLQQACDSGVLAARKRLGTEAKVTGEIPDDAAESIVTVGDAVKYIDKANAA